MIKTTLPVLEQEIKNNELISKEYDLEVFIDTSLYAETRWEQNFPKQAEKEGLFEYIERLHNLYSKENLEAVKIPIAIGMIKAIYCFIEFDKTWEDFQKMFSFNDPNYYKKLITRVFDIFTLVLNGSAEKNY